LEENTMGIINRAMHRLPLKPPALNQPAQPRREKVPAKPKPGTYK
jgi:hypothetical protein